MVIAHLGGSRVTSAPVLWEPLDKPAAYELIVSRLRRAIHLASYIPGDRLPPERTLADQFGVSRATVREALRVLQGEGYLTVRSGGLSTVRSPAITSSEHRQRLRQGWEEFDALITFRLAIECAAARLAATRRDDDDLRRIHGAVVRLTASRNLAEFRREDSAFHLAIAAAGRNVFLVSSIEDARAAMFWWVDALDPEVTLQITIRAHEKIAQAIDRGNGGQAARAMAAHIERTRSDLGVLVEKP